MPPPLILRVISDITGALKSNEELVGSNTMVGKSWLDAGKDARLGADAQIASAVKARRATEANLTALRAAQAKTVEGTYERTAANVAVADAESKLNRQMGITATTTKRFSGAAKEGERDLGKLTRGALAGSGAASSLGRSLAFASTGFIAIAGTATLITSSIKAAEDLEAAQRRTDQQLKTGGKSWDQYGSRISATMDKLRAVSGFTDTDLLQAFSLLFRASNNVGNSLKFLGVAADTARALNKPLTATSTALSKALGGNLSALRRLGVSIPTNLKRMEALNFVQAKFAGQAEAGTTASERFSAELQHSEAVIGTALLPTFTRLVTELAAWLTKMNESGKIQRDATAAVKLLGYGFHTLEGVIHGVDSVTGSFANTLKLIVEIEIARWAAKAIIGIDQLVGSWVAVEGAATAAAAAEEKAALAGGAAGAAPGVGFGVGGIAAALASRRAAKEAALGDRFPLFGGGTAVRGEGGRFVNIETAAAETGVAAIGVKALGSATKVGLLEKALAGLSKIAIPLILIPIVLQVEEKFSSEAKKLFGSSQHGQIIRDLATPTSWRDFTGVSLFDDIFRFRSEAQKAADAASKRIEDALVARLSKGDFGAPRAFRPAGRLGRAVSGVTSGSAFAGPFGAAQPIPVYTQYTIPLRLQIGQAQAGLTKMLADDVRVAKQIIANIRHLIDVGHILPGTKGYLSALEAWASAQSTLNSAEEQAAAKRRAAAQKALQIASSYTTPIDLQIAQVRAEMTASTRDDIRVEKQIIAAAKAALASGKKNKQGQLAALQAELQAQQALDSLRQQSATSFELPLKLQLALARAQALGKDDTAILEKMKRVLMKALKAARGNVQKQIDIWNQIAQINSQLGNSVTNAYGDFKKASTRWLTAGMGLTADQRRKLRQRLSQLGPGGTHPMDGTGAGGFVIDPTTGRPIHGVRTGRRGSDTSSGAASGRPPQFNAKIDLDVYIDGHQVEVTVTNRQHRRRRHMPTQVRGPHAATQSA
jgi:hypothetical protein